MKHNLLHSITHFLKFYLGVLPDKVNEQATVAAIKSSVSFRGANLWVLIFAILIASLGLNVNSTAVIIGAMLISPLMGPIIGMGLAIGIMDVELLKRSFRSFAVATFFSVLTATIYFWLTPLGEAQSELLARTSPTIYDVLIALLGGAAGILALYSLDKGNNVVPGVAIATALMPPLCTAGYGLAHGEWQFFAGAFYLYLINSVFIAFATVLGVRLLHFERVPIADKSSFRNVKRNIAIVTVLTILPALYLTVRIVRTSVMRLQLGKFATEQLNASGDVHVLSADYDANSRTVTVVALGAHLGDSLIAAAQQQLPHYSFDGYKLKVVQGDGAAQQLASEFQTVSQLQQHQILAQEASLNAVTTQLDQYRRLEAQASEVSRELEPLFPQVDSIAIARTSQVATGNAQVRYRVMAVAVLKPQRTLPQPDRARLQQWLRTRTSCDSLQLLVK